MCLFCQILLNIDQIYVVHQNKSKELNSSIDFKMKSTIQLKKIILIVNCLILPVFAQLWSFHQGEGKCARGS